jgi:cytochrome P450
MSRNLPGMFTQYLHCVSIPLTAVIGFIISIVIARVRLYWRRQQLYPDCKDSSCLPQSDRIFGLDTLLQSYRNIKRGVYLSSSQDRFHENGNTYSFNMLGARVVNTIDPENIKTVLATKFDDFALGSRREDAFTPLIGHGIFTADGAAWKRSRGLIRPNFANDKVTTFAMLEKHVSNFLDNIPGNGTLVDLGALFHRFTADTATEFLFGHSLHSLSPQGKRKDNAKQDFAGAFRRGQRAIANNFALGMFARLVPSLQFNRDRDCVHDFVDHCIKQGLEAAPEDKDMMERPPENDRSSHRYTFLTELAKNESDPEVLRGELLHILVAGRDTTASLLSNLWFVLARTPRVLNKLRQEIALLEGRRPSLEEVNEMGYLKRCVSECKS